LAWANAGKWTGLAPDDSPLVLRDTSVEEVNALDWEALEIASWLQPGLAVGEKLVNAILCSRLSPYCHQSWRKTDKS